MHFDLGPTCKKYTCISLLNWPQDVSFGGLTLTNKIISGWSRIEWIMSHVETLPQDTRLLAQSMSLRCRNQHKSSIARPSRRNCRSVTARETGKLHWSWSRPRENYVRRFKMLGDLIVTLVVSSRRHWSGHLIFVLLISNETTFLKLQIYVSSKKWIHKLFAWRYSLTPTGHNDIAYTSDFVFARWGRIFALSS